MVSFARLQLKAWRDVDNILISVLNVLGTFSLDVVDCFPLTTVRDELGVVPSLDEVRAALSLIAGNKAGDSNSRNG